MKNNFENLLKEIKNLDEVNIDPEFKHSAKVRLINTISNKSPIVKRPTFFMNIKPVGYVFAALGTVFILGGGTVFASQSSLPNSPLYPIKIASEKLMLNVAPTNEIKNQLKNEFSKRRIEEGTMDEANADSRDSSVNKDNQKLDTPHKKDDDTENKKSIRLEDSFKAQPKQPKVKEEKPKDPIQDILEDKVNGLKKEMKEEKREEDKNEKSELPSLDLNSFHISL